MHAEYFLMNMNCILKILIWLHFFYVLIVSKFLPFPSSVLRNKAITFLTYFLFRIMNTHTYTQKRKTLHSLYVPLCWLFADKLCSPSTLKCCCSFVVISILLVFCQVMNNYKYSGPIVICCGKNIFNRKFFYLQKAE